MTESSEKENVSQRNSYATKPYADPLESPGDFCPSEITAAAESRVSNTQKSDPTSLNLFLVSFVLVTSELSPTFYMND